MMKLSPAHCSVVPAYSPCPGADHLELFRRRKDSLSITVPLSEEADRLELHLLPLQYLFVQAYCCLLS